MGGVDVERLAGREKPVEERLVRLSVSSMINALTLVQQGVFSSFDEVVETAIEALSDALAEGQSRSRFLQGRLPTVGRFEVGDLTRGYAATVGAPEFDWPPNADLAALPTVDPVPRDRFASDIFLFTIPRLFPAKLVTRSLVKELLQRGSEWTDVEAFSRVLGPNALHWREYLHRLDRGSGRGPGERLSTALPSGKRDIGKSLDRFLQAYVGYLYQDQRLYGASPFLELITLEGSQKDQRIGITKEGLRFAQLENPILDSRFNTFPPFSGEEVDFIMAQLARHCPMEAEHMAFYLRVLQEGKEADRDGVNRKMRHFYERIWSPLELSGELVDSTRAAIHGRCQELGLARTTRAGRSATYTVTEEGLARIPMLPRIRRGIPEVGA